MSEGEFKKRSLTQYDMRNKHGQIAKDTGYVRKNGKIHPTAENIKALIDYDYIARFVPIEVINQARKECPLLQQNFHVFHSNTSAHLLISRQDFENLWGWFVECFGSEEKK